MPGLHNAENALAATAVLLDLGISMDLIRAGFATFEGIQRRFHCFAVGEAVMVDDYAHHPKEILSTLQAANSCWPERPVSALFQPHRYTRTQDLFDDFMGCFDGAQTVRILPIYAASEAPIEGVSATALVAGMRTRGHRDVDEVDSMQAAEAWVKAELVAGRVVLLMGAGSIGALATVLRKEMMTKAGQKS